jgi:NAD(P)-dependent dehydrogenase (short-subunit alcohol dehydrogenase family)
MTPLTDGIAIVTGAGHGIGHATTLALAHAGADVAVVDIDKAAAEKTAAAVAATGRRSLALATDVGDLASIDQMVGRVVETFGGSTCWSTTPASPVAPTSWISPRPTGIASCASTPRACSSACSAWRVR